MSNFKLGPNQRKWLRELPKYAKTEGALYIPGEGFCCLGVAAELFSPAPWEIDKGGDAFYRDRFARRNLASLAAEDWQALGLRSGAGSFDARFSGYPNLVDVNDNNPDWTHADMAKFIRKHADKIFVEAK